MIHFLLNQVPVQECSIAPNTSILDWLRTKRELTGTKEGCASGDCGACTVVIGELKEDRMSYRTANACLTLVSSLQGKQVMTVEHLSGNSGDPTSLHPVQQAMVDHHGSQCGFCTPGFIMSLYALYLNHRQYPGHNTVIEALGGNLCRCTGYRPILEAAKACFTDYPRRESACDSTIATLQQLQQQAQSNNKPLPDGIFIPTSLAQLLALKQQHPPARFVAGATDLSLEYSQQLKPREPLIFLGQIPQLQVYQTGEHHIEIGAALAYSDFYPQLIREYPEAEEVFLRLGSRQVRNLGTLGGSLGNASPIGDPAPLLLALGASIKLAGPSGERLIATSEFFTGYRQTLQRHDEVIQSVLIPRRQSDQALFFYKLSKRYEDDISTVCMALSLTIKNGLIKTASSGFGGMAATPAPARHLQQALIGQPCTPDALEQAALQLDRDFQPLSDARASASYRLQVARNLIVRCAHEHQSNNVKSSNNPVRICHA